MDKYNVYNHSRTTNKYTDFFNHLFIQPYNYFSQRALDFGVGFQLIYHYGPLLDAELHLEMNGKAPQIENDFDSGRAGLLFRALIKFYLL